MQRSLLDRTSLDIVPAMQPRAATALKNFFTYRSPSLIRYLLWKPKNDNTPSEKMRDSTSGVVKDVLSTSSFQVFQTLLQLYTPDPYVWSTTLSSGNVSIDRQHAMLMSRLESLDQDFTRKGKPLHPDDVLPRLQDILELWKTHIQFEATSLGHNFSSQQTYAHPEIVYLKTADETAIALFKQACNLTNTISRIQPTATQLEDYIQQLKKCFQAAIYRHVVLSTSIIAGRQQTTSSALLSTEPRNSSILEQNTILHLPCASELSSESRDSISRFSRAKLRFLHCNPNLHTQSQASQCSTQSSRWWTRWIFRASKQPDDPEQAEGMFRWLRKTHLTGTTFPSDKMIDPHIPQTDSHVGPGHDSCQEQRCRVFRPRCVTWHPKCNQLPSSESINTEQRQQPRRCTGPHTLSVKHDNVREFQAGPDVALEEIRWPLDISQPCARTIMRPGRQRLLNDPLHFLAVDATKFGEDVLSIATVLIDPNSRGYRMVRGDLQLRHMTLYQPWELAGQTLQFLLFKHRKLERHDQLMVRRINKFIAICARYRCKPDAHHNTVCYLIERLTLVRQNGSDMSVIAVFLPVIAHTKPHVLCLFIEMKENFDVSAILPQPDKLTAHTDFFLWTAQQFVTEGHAYRRLFADPCL